MLTLRQPAPGTSPGEFTSKERAAAWLDAERPALLRLIDEAATDGFDAQAWQLTWIIRRFLHHCGYVHELLAIQRTALRSARRLGDDEAQAYSHLGLGRTRTELGEFREADKDIGRALAIFREASHPVGEAYAACAAGLLMESQERHSEAITFTLQALSLAEAFAADPGMEFARKTATNNIAWLYACAGKLDEALSSATAALALFRQVDDSVLAASVMDTMGFIQHRLGNHAEAVGCYRKALDLFASLNSLYKAAEAAEHLAESYQALGDPAKARAALRACGPPSATGSPRARRRACP